WSTRRRGAWYVVGLVALQVAVAAAMVLLALPPPLQGGHVAVGTAVWAGLVLAVLYPSACPAVRPSDQDQLVLRARGIHLGTRRVDVHVDLAAHPETSRKVDTRLDREADAGHEGPRVLGLEVVDVRPGAVQVAIDRMARAMHEVFGEPRVADHGARGVVHLRSC